MAHRPEPPGPKPPLHGLLKMQVNWTGPGTPTPIAANILHVKFNDNINHPLADVQTIVNGVRSSLVTNMIPLVASPWIMGSVVATSLGGDGVQATAAGSTNGGTGTTSLTPNCAITTTWLAGVTWRGGRPRTYWVGVPSSNVVGGNSAALIAGAITSWGSGSTALMGAINALTAGGSAVTLGFPSYYTGYTIRPTPIFYSFVGARIHGRLDSQRRRLGKERFFG